MTDNYRIFDSDRHVAEPIEIWEKYLAPEFKHRAPYFEYFDFGDALGSSDIYQDPEGTVLLAPELMVDGAPVMRARLAKTRLALARAAQHRLLDLKLAQCPEGHIEQMDRCGIDSATLFPTFAMFLNSVDDMDADLVGAFARAYNDWLADFCSYAPRRLRGASLIPRHNPDDMVKELEKAAASGGTTVVLRPNPVQDRILSNPDYEPFWDACERHSISIAIHEGTHTRLATVGTDRFATRFGQHACSHPMEQMMALLALIEGGVLERHPNLQIAFFEAGCSWLPYWLWRLDQIEYAHLAAEVADNVRMKPSDYFRRQCWISMEPDEPNLLEVINIIGEDKILFGTDFPHVDHSGEVTGDIRKLREHLPTQMLRRIFWDNPARFFRLKI